MAKRKKAGEVVAATAEETAVAQTAEAENAQLDKELGVGETASELAVVMEVLPENLIIDPVINGLRDWTGESDQEMSIEELAASIDEEGQGQPGIGWETPDGIVLVAGHRRREAVQMLRRKGLTDILFRIVVDPTITNRSQALRKALHENEKRANFTDIERARHIQMLRGMGELAGDDKAMTTAEIASFLGKSPATVTQLEKLIAMPAEVHEDLKAGKIKTAAALEYTATPAEKVAEVHEAAKKKAKERVAKKQAAKKKAEKSATTRKPSRDIVKNTAAMKKELAEAKRKRLEREKREKEEIENAKITGQDVRAAQREVPGGLSTTKAPKMAEASALFEKWMGTAYPDPMRAFASAANRWSHGQLTDKKLDSTWDDLADVVHAGMKKTEKASASTKVETTATTRAKGKGKSAPAKKVAAKKAPAVKKTKPKKK